VVMAQELPGFPPRVKLAQRVSCVFSMAVVYPASGESQPQQT